MEHTEVNYAGFKVRLFAFLFDFILNTLTLAFLSIPLDPYIVQFPFILDGLVLFVLPWIIVLFWYIFGATIGKMIFKIKVVDSQTLKRPPIRRLVLRYFGYFICSFSAGLAYLDINHDKRKQALHDRMSKTVVIKH